MISITFPDGSKREFDKGITAYGIAKSISTSLAKIALAAKVDGQLVDLSFQIEKEAHIAIITEQNAEGLELIRHSTAHLLAYAVKSLFPSVQVTIGPVIEDGFYYDFSFERPFSQDDLEKIEQKMFELAKRDEEVTREVWKREDAIEFFKSIGEHYKAEIITAIPVGEDISLYREGDFIDLCRGPHVPSTGKLKVFKLLKVAGAYWRGDSNKEQLQRIYGTAWSKKEDLHAYLHRIEEAEKRDHRRLARELDLLHFQEEAPGLVFWHAKGWQIWQIIEQYMRSVYLQNAYQEVKAPQILDRKLWDLSGHWEHYQQNMFTTESESRIYALKPMNCPGHVQIYRSHLRSYRDLPFRLGEFGQCHRKEPSGALHGLMRVRGFTQDDGHIFCTEEQILDECIQYTRVLQKVYQDFGFEQIIYKVATRPSQRVGEDYLWDKAEFALQESLRSSGCDFEVAQGEGAFYGPKIEYTLKDAIGRAWQCGTIQVDFVMPKRLGAEYVALDNSRKTPVMLHRAVLGSLERFIGILIEQHAGAFPTWLAPLQVGVLCISQASADYAKSIYAELNRMGVRAFVDVRDDKISYKIREHSLQKIPYLVVVGDKEQSQSQISVRARGNQDLGTMGLQAFINKLTPELTKHFQFH